VTPSYLILGTTMRMRNGARYKNGVLNFSHGVEGNREFGLTKRA
jgi:hypothetical protein